MKIKIKSLHMENFKGCKNRTVEFSNKTKISGANATGKTTIFDAFTWLLFNKNSAGEEKFNVRPLDESGNQIDNVEIKVVAILDIDGKEIELSKVQKQKWVKKRGTNVTELQGNENLYEVGGYPKSEKDFKEYIASIMDENLFKMITSPYFFTSMKWQDQRNILMQFITEMSDLEMAQKNEKFAELIPDFENAPSTEDIKKKYQKALSEWKKKQAEIPTRIDEVSKQKVDIDVAELELAKNDLTEKIADVAEKIKSGNKVIDDLEQQKFELQFEINDCKRKANEVLIKKRNELDNKQYETTKESNDLIQKISVIERGIAEKKETVNRLESEKSELGEQYKAKLAEEFSGTLDFEESKWVFDESSTVCSLCGQVLPKDKIAEIKADFETRKADAKVKAEQNLANEKESFENSKESEIKRIIALGNEKKHAIEKLQKEIVDSEKILPEWKKELGTLKSSKKEYESKLAELPQEADLSSNEEYQALLKKDAYLAAQIATVKENGVNTDELENEKASYEDELENVKAELAQAAKNVEIDERIEELEKEQSEVGQKVADQEKMLCLLEEFIREKMNLISESINDKFNTVEWKLFEMQLNGGMKECCECTVNGVPFSTLNTGHRIVAGLDIINGLSELKGVVAPIFIDNCEAVSDGNLPNMDAQVISMYVSNDKELIVSE